MTSVKRSVSKVLLINNFIHTLPSHKLYTHKRPLMCCITIHKTRRCILRPSTISTNSSKLNTYPHEALLARSLIRQCACLSVCHSWYCIETDKDIIKLFLGLVDPPLWFSSTTHDYEILTGRGACHSGGLMTFSA